MTDPLDALPYELWIWCIFFAIEGQEAGPLELLRVSKRWEKVLLDTPSLWTQIYIQNGEDEISRASVFLHLSRGCSLHLDIMTPLSMDSLQLIAEHKSRVTTITIRPGLSDTVTASRMERWGQEASRILASLSDVPLIPDPEYTSCFGFSLWDNDQLYYCVVLISLALATAPDVPDSQDLITSPELPAPERSQIWNEHISRAVRISADWDTTARTDSVLSLEGLASYPRYHGAIRIAIPSCIRLLKDVERSVRSATAHVLQRFTLHVELHGALGLVFPSLIEVLEDEDHDVRENPIFLVKTLAKYQQLRESLGLAIPELIEVLGNGRKDIVLDALSLLGELAKHDELSESLGLIIPALIGLLEHWYSGVQSAAASLLKKLSRSDKVREVLGLAIPDVVKLLQHKYRDVQFSALSLLRTFAKRGTTYESLKPTIPLLSRLLQHSLSEVQSLSFFLLGRLAEHELREIPGNTMPALITLLEYWGSGGQRTIVFLLNTIPESDLPHGARWPFVSALIKLAEHWNSDIASTAASLLGRLIEHDAYHKEVRAATSALVKLPERARESVRSDAISILKKMTKDDDFREALRAETPALTELLEHRDGELRLAATYLLGELGMGTGIPIWPPIGLLKQGYSGVLSAAASLFGDPVEHA